jgi:hypothetical protein
MYNNNVRSIKKNVDLPAGKNGYMRFCNDEVTLDTNNYISPNQRLAGPANPKTLIAPVVVPRSHDLDHWRANNLINHSHINIESQWDTYLSGYEVSNCCDSTTGNIPVTENHGTVIEDFEYIGISDSKHPVNPKLNPISYEKNEIISPNLVTNIPFSKIVGKDNNDDYTERYSGIRDRNYSEGYEGYEGKNHIKPQHLQHVENYEHKDFIRPNESGWINTSCGYNPEQIENSNLPSNLASGKCERDETMKIYNKNLFTQTIQPDIYTINEVIEPINANIGISFTQQFEPTSHIRNEKDSITYTEHDPRIYQPNVVPNTPDMSVTQENIYDPRFSGYGTSYRAYTDKNIGQTRFYYDDINSVRMPNYIIRSNIDHIKSADSYGPLNEDNKLGNKNTNDIRGIVHDSFLQSTLDHRNDMMERLMRKRNGEMWQLRKYPKNTSQRSTIGGGPGR